MSPSTRVRAHAFVIWRYAHPRQWNVSYDEIAEATGLPAKRIRYVISAMKWGGKIRQSEHGILMYIKGARANPIDRPDLVTIFSNYSLTDSQGAGMD